MQDIYKKKRVQNKVTIVNYIDMYKKDMVMSYVCGLFTGIIIVNYTILGLLHGILTIFILYNIYKVTARLFTTRYNLADLYINKRKNESHKTKDK